MPDKRYVKGCGKGCIRCWVNRQNHGSKLKKKFFPKKFEDDEEEKVYISTFEEFMDKFIINNYSADKIKEIDESDFDATEFNEKLISDTTKAYNEWVLKEKGINKKMKDKELIKTMNDYYKNSEILTPIYCDKYPMFGVPDSEKFYMFECNAYNFC